MGEVELFEVYPNSEEWNAVLKASGLIDGTRACVVSISSVKVLLSNRDLRSPLHSLLVYQPSSLVRDLHSVLSQGWPSSGGRETLVVPGGVVSFEGDALCFMEGAPPGFGCFLMCEVNREGKAWNCSDQKEPLVVTRDTLKAAECTHAVVPASSSVPPMCVLFERSQARPRYLVRTVEKWQSQLNTAYCDGLRSGGGVGGVGGSPPPSPPSTPPIIFVHPTTEDSEATPLQDAINAAVDGSVIVLSEGVYRETITLKDKSLVLRGEEGKPTKPIIVAPADRQRVQRPTAAVRLLGPHTYVLQGLVIRANKRRKRVAPTEAALAAWSEFTPCPATVMKERKAGGSKVGPHAMTSEGSAHIDQGRCANALEIVEGVTHARISHCEMEGGVEVSGQSSAHILHSVIREGVVNGVYVCKAALLMEDCEVACHDSANVAVEQSEAHFLRVKIWGSLSTGVYLFNHGCATFSECEIFANAQTGIQMEGQGTNPVVRRCRIHHGDQYGMFITEKAAGLIEHNYFYANTWAAIALTEGGNSLVTNNMVSRGFHYGLYCFDNGKGHFVGNYVYGNKDAGLSVASGATPLAEGNEFMYGLSYGCYFFLKGMGELRHNKVYGHNSANVCITYGSDPIIASNAIFGGKMEGISVSQEGRGIIERNEVYNNYECNLMLQFEGNPVVRHNRFFSSCKTGVCFYHKSKGIFQENEVYASEYSGLAIKTMANPVVESNHFHDNKRYGILIQMGGKGVVRNNRFHGNTMGSVRVWNDCPEAEISDNKFEDAKEGNDTKILEKKPLRKVPPSPPHTPAPPLPGGRDEEDDDDGGKDGGGGGNGGTVVVVVDARGGSTANITVENAQTIALASLIPGETYEEFQENKLY